MRGNTRCPPRRHVILVGRDVHGAPRTRGRQRRRQRGRGPPGTSAPTRNALEHKVPHDANHVIRDTREHKVPHDANHVIMVGRDVHGAPRTRGRQRRRQRGRGPSGTSVPTRVHGNTRCRMMANMLLYGRARRPRRAAHTGMPAETPSGTRAAGDVGPYQGYTGTQGAV